VIDEYQRSAPLPDVVDRLTRSRMMSGIRSKDTKPELLVRRGLHALGLRYRLHAKDIPGTPDLVLAKYRAAIFVHGCFWHGHDCHLFKWPSTRAAFWRAKISRNHTKDAETSIELAEAGWRRAVVWECALKGRDKVPLERVILQLSKWLQSNAAQCEIRGSRV
jgi:DNA mismatch endonuclease (patch repair protein)